MTRPTIEAWLAHHGLEEHLAVFREHDVDLETLAILTEADLREIGLSFGARKRILHALSCEGAESGAPASGQADETVGERRQLTVLFSDMVGFTELATQLDPEVLRSIVHKYEDVCAACVARYEGYVYQRLGDGILAFFGYPLAHEGEAERAIHAGLEIIESLALLEVPEVGHLDARVGIATGEVVVTSAERGAVGETMNLASRLQGIAAPNTVIVSPHVYMLAGGAFEYEDLGEKTLKGIPAPVRAYRVLKIADTASRFEAAAHRGLSPLVGREPEIRALLERWERARAGSGQVVLLSGEPGIGKSRITSTVCDRLIGEGATPLFFQCSPYHVNSALHPCIGTLRRVLGVSAHAEPGVQLAELESAVAGRYCLPISDVALIGHLLSIPCEARFGPLAMNPRRLKEETIRAVIDLLERIAAQSTSLLIFEDLHWADPTTLELLDQLLRRIGPMRMLVIDTSRPEFQSRWPDQENCTRLVVSRLDGAESAVLVRGLVDGKALPAGLLEQIVARGDGVPLFIEELTRSVLESGTLREEGDRYVPAGAVAEFRLPTTLRDLLVARLDRVSSVKQVAQIGAAIGREFSYELLAAVAPLKGAELESALSRLIESGLASRQESEGSVSFVFKHALIQDAAYESMLKSRRQQLHGRIAATMEQRFPELRENQPELLAQHFSAAHDLESAIRYWQLAGERAMARFALAEACSHFERALALTMELPEGRERDLQELRARSRLGPAFMARKGWAATEVRVHLEPALALARSLDDAGSFLPVLHGLWVNALVAGRLDDSARLADEMLAFAAQKCDEEIELSARRAAMTSQFWLGNLVAARAHGDFIQQHYDLDRHGGIARRTNSDPLTGDGIYRGQYLWMLGYPDQALEATLANHAHAAKLKNPFDLAFSLTLGAQIFNFLARPDELLRCAERAEQVGREHGLPVMSEALAAICEGMAFVEADRLEDGIETLSRSTERLLATGQRIWAPYVQALQADALGRAGEPALGLKLVDEALEQIEARDERCHFAEVLRIRGELLGRLDRAADAEQTLRRAMEFAHGQQAKSWELRAAISLARMLAANGRTAEAHESLSPVYAWFDEGLATPDLRAAKELLAMSEAPAADGREANASPNINS